MSNIRAVPDTDVIAPTRRRLTDLYMKGKMIAIVDDNPDEEAIEVWVSKISPLQRKTAADKASSIRAATLALRRLPEDSEEKLNYYDQMEALGFTDRDSMIDFVISPEVQKVRAAIEAELAAEDEWAENDYLNALQDAWNETLADKWVEDPEDPEAKRVYDELKRYTERVNEIIKADTDGLRRDLDDVDDEKLQARVVDRLIETESDINWIIEFRKWQVYFATRLPENHKMLYFVDKYEVDELQDEVFGQLFEAFNDLSVDAIEGKDSEATPSS